MRTARRKVRRQKPVLTHRFRRMLHKQTSKVKLTDEQQQNIVNSQARRLERKDGMTLEQRRERRKTLRAQTGIYTELSTERNMKQIQNDVRRLFPWLM